jgi:hypothetical protein
MSIEYDPDEAYDREREDRVLEGDIIERNMSDLPPVGSDKYDDLKMEAMDIIAEERHDRGQCDPANCWYCDHENT